VRIPAATLAQSFIQNNTRVSELV